MRRIAICAALCALVSMHHVICMETATNEELQKEESERLRLRCGAMSMLSMMRGIRVLNGLEAVRQVDWPASALLLSAFPPQERELQLRAFDGWLATIEWVHTPLGMEATRRALGMFYEQLEASGRLSALRQETFLGAVQATAADLECMQDVLSRANGVGYLQDEEARERVFYSFKLLVQPAESVSSPLESEEEMAEYMANHGRRLRLLREGIDHWSTGVAPE